MEILAENDLLDAVENNTFIKDGSKDSCEGIKYDFILSSRSLTVDYHHSHDIEQISDAAVIKPGEIAYVMTKETLELPDNIYCQLSAKRKLSLEGIVILGGLIIDPNYKGKLIFGLYNLSSSDYPILPGKKLIAGVFYKVDKKTNIQPESIHDFPEELVKIVINTKPNTINSFNCTLDDLRKEMQAIKSQFTHDNQWKNEFQTGLTEIRQLIKEMGEKLDTEINTRQNETLEIKNDLVKFKGIAIPMSQDQKKYHILITVLIGIIASIVGGIFIPPILRFLGN